MMRYVHDVEREEVHQRLQVLLEVVTVTLGVLAISTVEKEPLKCGERRLVDAHRHLRHVLGLDKAAEPLTWVRVRVGVGVRVRVRVGVRVRVRVDTRARSRGHTPAAAL